MICGAMLLLSRATGSVQFTTADEFMPRFARISEGQLKKTGGTTSATERGEIERKLEKCAVV